MSNYSHDFVVSKFNEMLQLVRETIKKDRKLKNIGRSINDNTNELEKINKLLKDIDIVINSLTEYGMSANFINQKKELSEKAEKIASNLNTLNDSYDILEDEHGTDMYYISSILAFMYRCSEKIESDELNEEYLEEYLYICFSEKNSRSSFIERMTIEAWEKIEKLLYKKYSIKNAEQLIGPIYSRLGIYRDWQTEFENEINRRIYFEVLGNLE